MTSAVNPLQIAIDSLISGDGALDGILVGQKVYSLVALEGSLFPYIVMGESAESTRGLFQKSAKDGVEIIHIFSEMDDKTEVLTIYEHLDRLLNKTQIIVAGHTVVMGRLRLITIMGDPKGGTHLVARYEVLTTQAA